MISEDQRDAARRIAARYIRRGGIVDWKDKPYGKNLYVNVRNDESNPFEYRWRVGPRDTVMEIRRGKGSPWHASGVRKRYSTKALAAVWKLEGGGS